MVGGESAEPVRREAMVRLNEDGDGQPRLPREDIIEVPLKGTVERLLYDMDGLFGLAVEYKGEKTGRSFSKDGLEELVDKFSMYMLAQIARRWNETRTPPTQMTIKMLIEWHCDNDDEEVGRCYVGEKDS